MYARERIHGIVMICLALAIAGGATGYVLANRQPELVLDADHCPATPVATWFAIVDDTDVWPQIEQQRMAKGLLGIAERMPKNARLELHRIGARADDARPPWRGFQKCKSADPATVNPLYQNEQMEREHYQRHFLKPLESLLPELLQGHAASQSPILESLEVLFWSAHFRGDLPQRTLAIYSDLLQHTKALSHLKAPLPDLCQVLASDIGRRLKAHDWSGVRVSIEYLRNARDAARQGPAHLRWWAQLFYHFGAAEVFDGPTLIAYDVAATCGKE